MSNLTDKFVTLLCSIEAGDIPERVWRQASRCLKDYVAVAVAGSRYFHDKELALLRHAAKGDALVIGHDIHTDHLTAALVNGMSAHVVELDDGHRRGAVHVGATVFSALISVAHEEKLSLRDVLYGAIVGYEATIRLACAVQPGNKLRGYHATGTCGTLGATMAVCAALHMDAVQTKSALSAAVASAAGVLEMQEDNSDMKPLNVGRAAMDAVAAAYIGKAGFAAPLDAIGGRRGFLRVMTDDPHPEYLTSHSEDYLIEQIYMKSYAACRHAHPAIEAALKLHSRFEAVDKVVSVTVETYHLAVAGHDHTDIEGVSSAKMSIPFGVALALYQGKAGVDVYDEEHVGNPLILALAKKVNVVENDELSLLCPARRAAIVTLRTENGEWSERVDYPKGEPENPLSDEELDAKYNELVGDDHELANHVMHLSNT